MAITQDGLYVATIVDALNNDLALDLSDAAAFKLAMFTDSLTPDFSAAAPAYGTSPYDANEVSGPGYTAGGIALASAVFEELSGSAGTVRWDFANISWTSSISRTKSSTESRGFARKVSASAGTTHERITLEKPAMRTTPPRPGPASAARSLTSSASSARWVWQ